LTWATTAWRCARVLRRDVRPALLDARVQADPRELGEGLGDAGVQEERVLRGSGHRGGRAGDGTDDRIRAEHALLETEVDGRELAAGLGVDLDVGELLGADGFGGVLGLGDAQLRGVELAVVGERLPDGLFQGENGRRMRGPADQREQENQPRPAGNDSHGV